MDGNVYASSPDITVWTDDFAGDITFYNLTIGGGGWAFAGGESLTVLGTLTINLPSNKRLFSTNTTQFNIGSTQHPSVVAGAISYMNYVGPYKPARYFATDNGHNSGMIHNYVDTALGFAP